MGQKCRKVNSLSWSFLVEASGPWPCAEKFNTCNRKWPWFTALVGHIWAYWVIWHTASVTRLKQWTQLSSTEECACACCVCRIPANRLPYLRSQPEVWRVLLWLGCLGIAVWWAVERHARSVHTPPLYTFALFRAPSQYCFTAEALIVCN